MCRISDAHIDGVGVSGPRTEFFIFLSYQMGKLILVSTFNIDVQCNICNRVK